MSPDFVVFFECGELKLYCLCPILFNKGDGVPHESLNCHANEMSDCLALSSKMH